jgi:hypothetical protein
MGYVADTNGQNPASSVAVAALRATETSLPGTATARPCA